MTQSKAKISIVIPGGILPENWLVVITKLAESIAKILGITGIEATIEVDATGTEIKGRLDQAPCLRNANLPEYHRMKGRSISITFTPTGEFQESEIESKVTGIRVFRGIGIVLELEPRKVGPYEARELKVGYPNERGQLICLQAYFAVEGNPNTPYMIPVEKYQLK